MLVTRELVQPQLELATQQVLTKEAKERKETTRTCNYTPPTLKMNLDHYRLPWQQNHRTDVHVFKQPCMEVETQCWGATYNNGRATTVTRVAVELLLAFPRLRDWVRISQNHVCLLRSLPEVFQTQHRVVGGEHGQVFTHATRCGGSLGSPPVISDGSWPRAALLTRPAGY